MSPSLPGCASSNPPWHYRWLWASILVYPSSCHFVKADQIR
jgi:hypothetical protein